MKEKVCIQCKDESLGLDAFSKDSKTPDKLSRRCRKCQSDYKKGLLARWKAKEVEENKRVFNVVPGFFPLKRWRKYRGKRGGKTVTVHFYSKWGEA